MAWAGVAAGPLLVVVLAGQAVWHPGYDVGTDPISSLALGPHGWVQIVTFVVVGLLVAGFGTGLLSSVRAPAERVAGLLLVLMGAGLAGVGAFVTDPVAWRGHVHDVATGVAINAGLAAAVVLALVWWRQGHRVRAGYGAATVVVCAALGWSTNSETIALRHTAVIVVLAVWLTTTALALRREPRSGPVTAR